MNSVIALIYCGQLREMRNSNQATQEALKITRDQFNLQNRAYLELVDANGKGGGYGMAKVVLKNYGHTTARNLTLHLSLDRLRVDPPTLKVRIVEKIPFTMTVKSVPPGDVPTYIGGVYAPTYRDAAKVGHTDALRIIGDGFYDTGFGQEDTIVICLAFQGGRNQWEPCAGNESVTVKRSPH
jgi:hypothetical protein